jgi:stage II sporulation protein D
MLLAISATAESRIFEVRLFWQHPPTEIEVVPHGASFRSCVSCGAHPVNAMTEITADGSSVVAGTTRSLVFLLEGSAQIRGKEFPAFSVHNPLRIEARDGSLWLTLSMPIEEYVTAVLQGESAGFKSDEALKAMAVAARTYAVHFGSRHRAEGFDFCDSTHCQDLRPGNESARIRAAVTATEGELLWWQGRPAATYYHRSCGGELDNPGMLDVGLRAPYLRQRPDQYCLRNRDEWSFEIAKAELARALDRQVHTVAVGSRSNSGRVERVLIDARAISATDFRLAIGRALGWDKLRSDLYQVQDFGDRVAFHGRGQGHGVGLCQAGAENMGEQGHNYREILAFYYPGTTPGLNAQGLVWEKLPGESVDLLTTDRSDAGVLLPAAERALQFATESTGWHFDGRPQLKVYPTMAIYRDATGVPGWVAASTRGDVVRLQPRATLERAHALDSTLRHEFLHMLVESHARPDTPLWLREGLVVYLTDPKSTPPASTDPVILESQLRSARNEAEMRSAYRACAAAIAAAVQRQGLPALLTQVAGKQ